MDQDNGTRYGYAVGISVQTTETGSLRLVLDDLELDGRSPITWKHWAFFTLFDLPEDRALHHDLAQSEYAAIGEAVLARLLALRSLSTAAPKVVPRE